MQWNLTMHPHASFNNIIIARRTFVGQSILLFYAERKAQHHFEFTYVQFLSFTPIVSGSISLLTGIN
jgi:hypothetical protein